MVGYSRLMGRDEAGTLARLRDHRHQCLEPALARHGGRLVKLTGDGALVEFASAVEAVSAAIEFQVAMAEAGDRQDDMAIVFRIGVHLGDLIVDGNDLYGDGVNVASRLEAEAPSGGIIISGDVHNAVAGRLKATFDDLGDLALKNIEHPVRAHRASWSAADWPVVTPEVASAALAGVTPKDEPLALPDKPSIAVLPFTNMSGDPEQEYFVDGLVEDIITVLSRFKSLFVIARNSSFTYKGRAVDLKQVGRELGVRYVLEGSVRKAGNRIRITGQLIDAESGAHLWADRFDGQMEEVFDLQDRVANKVVSIVAPKLQQSDMERARRNPTTQRMDSYDWLLRGMAAVFDRSKWSTSDAQDSFRRAVQLDPTYATALSWLAYSIQLKAISKGIPLAAEERTEALELAVRACKFAGDDGAVLARAAHVFCYSGKQYERASSLVEDAIELNPNDARTWVIRGWVTLMCNQYARAIESFERALELNPLDPGRGNSWNGMAFAHFGLGEYDQGRTLAEKSAELVADAHSLPLLIALEVRSGRLADARRHAAQLMKMQPTLRSSYSRSLFPIRAADFHDLLVAALREAGIPD